MSQEAQTPQDAGAEAAVGAPPEAAGADSQAPIAPDAAAAAYNPLVSPDAPVREQPPLGSPGGSSTPPATAETAPPMGAASQLPLEPRPPLAGPAAAHEGLPQRRPSLIAKLGLPEDRPEIAAGAAFGSGLVVALILKRLAR